MCMILWVQMVAAECSRTSVLSKHCIPWTFSPLCQPCVYHVCMYLYDAVILMYACSYCIRACTLHILLSWLRNFAVNWIMSEYCLYHSPSYTPTWYVHVDPWMWPLCLLVGVVYITLLVGAQLVMANECCSGHCCCDEFTFCGPLYNEWVLSSGLPTIIDH